MQTSTPTEGRIRERATLARSDIDELIAHRARPCASVFLPTHRAGRETRQGPIRLKNLLSEAETELTELGCAETDVTATLGPARDLVSNDSFWERQLDGLALFLSPELHRAHRVPRELPPRVVCGSGFHVRPLLPLLERVGRYHVLALSENDVRLFAATPDELERLPRGDLPRGVAEALWMDDPERSVQHHAGGRASWGRGGGRSDARFHGHGVTKDAARSKRERFCRRVDAVVSERLATERTPLVVAAVERLIAAYRDVSSYPLLVADGVPGNPENLPLDELAARSRAVVEARGEAERADALARYRAAAGTGKSAAGVAACVRHAVHGRVDTLLVARTAPAWGALTDRDSADAEVHEERHAGDDDLIDLAARETLLHGGRALTVPPAEMPSGRSLVASLRY